MINLNLIPFGLETQTGELIDVTSVPSGKGCGCICPSCKAPLIARKGEINEWHFAHLSRGTYSATEDACDYSFYVSARMMARQLIEHDLQLLLPELVTSVADMINFELVERKRMVTESRLINISNCNAEQRFYNAEIDIVGEVGGIPFGIYFTHSGRELPLELNVPTGERCGLIAVSLSSLPMKFVMAKQKKVSYREVLQNLLAEDINSKSWVYHPRYKPIEAALKRELSQLKSEAEKSKPEPAASTIGSTYQNKLRNDPSFLIRFECTSCLVQWDSLDASDINCPNCHRSEHRKALNI